MLTWLVIIIGFSHFWIFAPSWFPLGKSEVRLQWTVARSFNIANPLLPSSNNVTNDDWKFGWHLYNFKSTSWLPLHKSKNLFHTKNPNKKFIFFLKKKKRSNILYIWWQNSKSPSYGTVIVLVFPKLVKKRFPISQGCKFWSIMWPQIHYCKQVFSSFSAKKNKGTWISIQ